MLGRVILSSIGVVGSAEAERFLGEIGRGLGGRGRRCAVLAGGLLAFGQLILPALGRGPGYAQGGELVSLPTVGGRASGFGLFG